MTLLPGEPWSASGWYGSGELYPGADDSPWWRSEGLYVPAAGDDPVDALKAKGNWGPDRWIGDTGSGHDLISRRDLAPADFEGSVEGDGITLTTVNGPAYAGTRIKLQSSALWDEIEPLVLVDTPAIISVGRRCMMRGYDFIWKAGRKPYMIDPAVRRIPMSVQHYVPFLVERGRTPSFLPSRRMMVPPLRKRRVFLILTTRSDPTALGGAVLGSGSSSLRFPRPRFRPRLITATAGGAPIRRMRWRREAMIARLPSSSAHARSAAPWLRRLSARQNSPAPSRAQCPSRRGEGRAVR